MHAESHSPTEARSHEEVRRALAALAEEDLNRLATAAGIWIRDLGLDTAAADADDLVSEAIFRTTSGQRAWKVGVDFYHHLREIMKSIVDSWHKSAQRRRASGAFALRESELPRSDADPSNDDVHPLSEEPTPETGVLLKLIGREEARAFETHFADDEAALKVLEGVKWEMKGPRIQEEWGLSRKEYEAARRRIWRHRDRVGGSRGR